jgi:glycyl-tRNA synthetase alpha subunit
VRNLARAIAQAYLKSREELGFPMLVQAAMKKTHA